MSEVKDPAIKLFGKTICLLRDDVVSCSVAATGHRAMCSRRSSFPTTSQDNKNTSTEVSEIKQEEESGNATAEEKQSPDEGVENEDESDSREKPMKKPDKILACPRCNSMETKFCYYNNYNVNQPRYFCKNCQRYWTAGGSMRNVPVGSGRRKNKNSSASTHRHIMVPEAHRFDSLNSPKEYSPWHCSFYGFLGPWIPAPDSPVLSTQSSNQSCLVTSGKHSREGHVLKQSKIETLDSSSSSTLFKAFNNSKGDDQRNRAGDNSLVLQANPAALSRSLNFHERT